MDIWKQRFEIFFGERIFVKRKACPVFTHNKVRAISKEERLRTFVWISLLISGTFWSFYGFYHSQNDRPRPFCKLSAKNPWKKCQIALYCVISAKNDFWARLRAFWSYFTGFVAQNNQKGLFFHIQFEEVMSEICKAQMNDLKISLRFDRLKSSFGGIFRKQKYPLGSYLIVGKEKSEKNQFANF